MNSQRFVQTAAKLTDVANSRKYKMERWTTVWGDRSSVYDDIKRNLQNLSKLRALNVFDFYEHSAAQLELGLKIKADEREYVIEVEGADIVTRKTPGQLRIRLNFNYDIEFQAISPFFHEKDGLRTVKTLAKPISPDEYMPETLPDLVIEWMEFIAAWENQDR
jgi:hypothetical protein